MFYEKPELHEVGTAELLIQGSASTGLDNGEFLNISLTLEDFDE